MTSVSQSFEVQTKVLHGRFDFNLHNATFSNYCEVVILEDGTIEYAVPSHQQKMLDVFCKKFNVDKRQLINDIDRKGLSEWYFELCSYMSKCMLVSNVACNFTFIPNAQQERSLKQLVYHGCINSAIFNEYDANIRAFEKLSESSNWHENILPKIMHFFD